MSPRNSLHSVVAAIESDPSLAELRDIVVARLDGDPGHDLAHALRVALWTLELGEGHIDNRAAIAAALLHDVVNLPKDSPQSHSASEQSADVARDLLPGLGFGSESVEEIADAIRDHSFSRGAVPETDLGRCLQDADRLEALGVLGIFRAVATGARLGGAFFDPDDPWAEARPLDDKVYTLDHFFTKLLRLPHTLLTEAGRHEAARRAETLRVALGELGRELGSAEGAARRAEERALPGR